MTTPRTIPANPQPGERYASLIMAPSGAEMWVVRLRGSHPEAYTDVGLAFTEADARLLVFGAKAVEAVLACDICFCTSGKCDDADCIAARAALADLEVPT